ncbi:universal stress protein [Limosilactobacillus fermentum]|uniref:universal stress protein n=1 Tax=Limosilactobacillus fermentum TaxID=1613 RepID=UPI001076464F|nr:universal stress protein [Limosilactobacillus fermentum]MCC6111795.1 universal stress protein [Limosilactobacillus fermentum]TFZ14957.1 universal stress protein [Limosilactobacillus fermentum]
MVYQRILVGLDGSKPADRAFKVGCSLARSLSAKLYVIWIVNRDRGMDSSFGVNEDFYQDLYRQVTQKIKPYLEQAQEQKIKVVDKVLIGNVKTILAKEFPQEQQIDLIILGNTGINAVEKMVQGSHSDYVIRHASCDVLVVK